MSKPKTSPKTKAAGKKPAASSAYPKQPKTGKKPAAKKAAA